jgi:SpoIIAA-like
MRGFRGWTPAAFLRDLRWDLRNRRTFSKIAVVGDRSWHRWIAAAGKPLFRAPMKFFRAGPAAEAWLSNPR